MFVITLGTTDSDLFVLIKACLIFSWSEFFLSAKFLYKTDNSFFMSFIFDWSLFAGPIFWLT